MSASGDSKNTDKKSDNESQLPELIAGVMQGDLAALYKISILLYPLTETKRKAMLDSYLKVYETMEAKSFSVTEQAAIGYLFRLAGAYDKAVLYTEPAANQDNPLAQSNLGVMYYYGQGVAQDLGEAVKWYQLAANQGDPLAHTI